MRKLLISSGDLAFQPYSPPPPSSPLPSPYPSSIQYPNFFARENFFFPSIPVAKSVFDLATLSFVAGLLLLSLLAVAFIFHLRLRSRRAYHLQNFNSLWIVRLLLVSLASLWAVNEILRLPFIRRKHLYPFLPSISLKQQENICKLHVVLSLGFFEPGFLITLLFLVNVSIKKKNPPQLWAIASVLILCSPIILLQIIFVFFSPFESFVPKFTPSSSVLTTDHYGNKSVLCVYPIMSSLAFSGFTIAYATAFLLSCWRVMALVINKGIRQRISMLATTVMVALPLQIICLSLSWLWMSPEDAVYGSLVLAMFVSVAWCMAVGEVILVLRPIRDTLEAGGDCCRWSPGGGYPETAKHGDKEQGRNHDGAPPGAAEEREKGSDVY
ncbi:hypothetical protein BUALT_Bualt06G0084800 [Buddleja alternifolia]|uniref:Uncharacterized protein n=1 Tax=Buddleja alternifolia TaxID=168488 RepID=A0AAV6XLJ6_9LAMI|nr:hypothetical protein BUALT_Bualt06G0084800 [Buddleja alternifolia]